MKIITRSQITSISASSAAITSDYAVDSCTDEYTQHAYIANAATTTIALQISAGTNALMLSHYFAESINIIFKDSATTISTASSNQTFDSTDTVFAENQTSLMPPIWFDVPNNCDNIEIVLTNSANRKQTLDNWAATGSNSEGRFRDSNNNSVACLDAPQLRIGSIINSTYQILQRNGDGTAVDDIVLTPSANSAFSVTDVLMPVYVGILRCGTVETYPSFQVGAQGGFDDSSLRQRTANGEYNFQNQNITNTISGSIKASQTQLEDFMTMYKRFRSKPVGVKLFDFDANDSVMFAYFADVPVFAAESKLYNLHNISMRLNAL